LHLARWFSSYSLPARYGLVDHDTRGLRIQLEHRLQPCQSDLSKPERSERQDKEVDPRSE
jgi:hypothetical protein